MARFGDKGAESGFGRCVGQHDQRLQHRPGRGLQPVLRTVGRAAFKSRFTTNTSRTTIATRSPLSRANDSDILFIPGHDESAVIALEALRAGIRSVPVGCDGWSTATFSEKRRPAVADRLLLHALVRRDTNRPVPPALWETYRRGGQPLTNGGAGLRCRPAAGRCSRKSRHPSNRGSSEMRLRRPKVMPASPASCLSMPTAIPSKQSWS